MDTDIDGLAPIWTADQDVQFDNQNNNTNQTNSSKTCWIPWTILFIFIIIIIAIIVYRQWHRQGQEQGEEPVHLIQHNHKIQNNEPSNVPNANTMNSASSSNSVYDNIIDSQNVHFGQASTSTTTSTIVAVQPGTATSGPFSGPSVPFYSQCNYQGNSVSIPPGWYPSLAVTPFANQPIASAQLSSGQWLHVCSGVNFTGNCQDYYNGGGSATCFTVEPIQSLQLSSIQSSNGSDV